MFLVNELQKRLICLRKCQIGFFQTLAEKGLKINKKNLKNLNAH